MVGRFVESWIGEAALRRLRDLVLLDLMLPDTNGYEVCRRLRGSKSIITGFAAGPKGSGCEDHTRRAGEVNVVCYFRIVNPIEAIVNVEDRRRATF